MSSWMLVRLVSAEPRWELLKLFSNYNDKYIKKNSYALVIVVAKYLTCVNFTTTLLRRDSFTSEKTEVHRVEVTYPRLSRVPDSVAHVFKSFCP